MQVIQKNTISGYAEPLGRTKRTSSSPLARKNSNNIWYFARFALSLATPKILPLEKTQILFGFLLAYSYLCNMRTKNLYINIGLSVRKALIFNVLPPPICKNRLKRQTNPKFHLARIIFPCCYWLRPLAAGIFVC